MRLKFNYENKIKIGILYLVIAFVVPAFVLSFVRLTSLAASSDYVTSMPLYVSPSLGANQGKPSNLDLQDLYDDVYSFFSSSPYYNPFVKCIIYCGSDDNGNIFVTAFDSRASYTVSNYPLLNGLGSFDSNSDFTFSVSTGQKTFSYNLETGTLSEHSHTTPVFHLQNYLFEYVDLSTSSFYALMPNIFIPGYPLYISDDIVINDNVYFRNFAFIPDSGGGGGDDSGGSVISGTGSGSIVFDGGSGGSDDSGGSFDFDIDLDFDDSAIIGSINDGFSTIGGSLDSIGGSIDSIGSSLDGLSGGISSGNSKLDTINGKLDSINGKLTDSTDGKSWLQKIYELLVSMFSVPTQTEIDSALEDFPVVDDFIKSGNKLKSKVYDIFDFSSVSAKSVNDVDFDYDFHWQVYDFESGTFIDKVTTVHIVFSWYESIRYKVLLVLGTFLVLCFVTYLMRQFPNMLHGVSAGSSAGKSVAEAVPSSGGVDKYGYRDGVKEH